MPDESKREADQLDESSDSPPQIQNETEVPFPVIGIGASAGGLEAFEQFFTNMTPDSGAAFVLVQHLDPTHESILVDLLKRYTRMPVVQVRNGLAVKPNHVYVIPPNRDMALLNGKLQLKAPAQRRGLRLPIDFFFRSLAEDQKDRAICIVLSGTGSDGTLGLKAIKGEGGLAIVQEPASARYDGMPYNAVATGMADYILPPEKIPNQLLTYFKHAFISAAKRGIPLVVESSTALQKIMTMLQRKTTHDFSGYKQNTIGRRIERRMAVNQIREIDDYTRLLQQNPLEVETLFRELLIGVTSFFRNPEAYDLLRERVIPAIFQNHSTKRPVRIWVPGCSTGEEAYSIAMLVREHINLRELDADVQIFATDIDSQAIEKARAGVYPDNIAADVSSEQLHRFFHKEGNTYHVQKSLRDVVVFAVQSLAKDPPFSKLDLISCRNVLIYFGSQLQRRAISLFHYALNPSGYLLLGNSETLGQFAEHFTVIDKKWKLFQRPVDSAAIRSPVNFTATNAMRHGEDYAIVQGHDRPLTLQNITQRLLLEEYAPSCLIVNEQGEIQYFHGRTGKYLEPAPGEPSLNLLYMAREGLRMPISSAMRRAVAEKRHIRKENVLVKSNSGQVRINLTIKPLLHPPAMQGMFMVVFEETDVPPPEIDEEKILDDTSDDEGDRRIFELKHELSSTREYLQTTIEELETSNEELKSTNEELQSSNEELQSTNEELETSKEELQSVNEELVTVNHELQSKIDELTRANNDISNLLSSAPVGIIFLDQRLQIVRFNREATEIVNLIETDVGRPLEHLVSNLAYQGLVADCNEVLKTLQSKKAEVQSKEGNWFTMRIEPYRTLQNTVEGLVLSFSEITLQKETQQQLRERERFIQQVTNTTPSLIYVYDLEKQKNVYVNQRSVQLLGYTPEQVEDMGDQMAGKSMIHPDDQETNQAHLAKLMEQPDDTILETEYRIKHKDGQWRWLRSQDMVFARDESGKPTQIMGTAEDITDRKTIAEALQKSESMYRTLADNTLDTIIRFDRQQRYVYVNPAMFQITGTSREEYIGKLRQEMDFAPELDDYFEEKIESVFETAEPMRDQFSYPDSETGDQMVFDWIITPEFDTDDTVVSVLTTMRDITDLKKIEEALQTALTEKETLLQEVHHRVKNNLQSLVYLIEMQTQRTDSAEALEELQELRGRVQAMAMTHDHLYRTKSLTNIDSQRYLQDLANNLLQSLVPDRKISIEVTADKQPIGPEIAIPCGLIINELVTNAIKHAFPPDAGQTQEKITINMVKSGGLCKLVVSDTGQGFPPDLDWQSRNSLGLMLVKGWATRQLGGDLEIESRPDQGTVVTVKFDPQRLRGATIEQ